MSGRRDVMLGAIRPYGSVFEFDIPVFTECLVQALDHRLSVLKMDAVDERGKIPADGSTLQAVKEGAGLGPVAFTGCEVCIPHAEPRRLQREAHALLCLVKRLLCSYPFGDVAGHAQDCGLHDARIARRLEGDGVRVNPALPPSG